MPTASNIDRLLDRVDRSRAKAPWGLALPHQRITSEQLEELLPHLAREEMLVGINLNGNEITRLPGALLELTHLQWLLVSNNPLETLPPGIGRLRRLKEFAVSENSLTELPGSFCGLVNLRKLMIRGTRIEELPPGFGQLTRLKALVASNNALREFPPGIEGFERLRILDLSGNRIEEIPPRLPQLEWLDLSANQVREVPESLGDLVNLKELDLSQNQVRSLPNSLSRLERRLRKLRLHGNPLPRFILDKPTGGLAGLLSAIPAWNALNEFPLLIHYLQQDPRWNINFLPSILGPGVNLQITAGVIQFVSFHQVPATVVFETRQEDEAIAFARAQQTSA